MKFDRAVKVHPVTGPIVDTHFRDTFADRLHISRISECQPIQLHLNTSPGAHVP